MSETSTARIGVGFFDLLLLLFITLKLTGYINWSWWWVLSPLWIPLSVFLVIVAIIGVIAAVVSRR